MRTTSRIAALGLAAALALGLTACTPPLIRHELPRQEAEQRTVRQDAQGAESVDARFEIGAGRLTVSGGAAELMEAEFDYRPVSWKPIVEYSLEGSRGVLSVSQPHGSGPDFRRNPRNEWDVRLNDDIPLDLTVEKGAGESNLRVGELNLRSLTVQGGAGDTEIDLTGTPRGDVRVEVENGVGSVTLRVPRDVGVRISGIRDGVGEWQAEGFVQRGENEAVNEAYDTAKVRFDISIQRGVGSVRVEQV
jgi:hypothetical protein